MKKQQFISILDRYLKNQATAEEQNLLHAYYHLFMADDDVLLLLKDEEKEKLKLQIKAGINARIGKIETDVAAEPLRRIRLWPRIAIAAAAVAAIVFGVWFFNSDTGVLKQVQDDVVQNDIAPGKNGATITLANGKVIQLSDAKTGIVIGANSIKYNDGSFLSPSGRDGVAREGSGPVNPLSPQGGSLPEGERSMALTASTAKGQTYQFTLPDGTKVWLNAASTIRFPSQFIGKERKILLDGEGYFEVEKDKAHPFIVATDKQTVEVLGTHFNINSYSNESSVRTTLLEGAVRVGLLSPSGGDGVARGGSKNSRNPLSPQGGSLPGGERNIMLKPNQQSIITGSNRIAVTNVDATEAVAWKNGSFKFNDVPLESIMRQLSRWYDIDVSYQGAASTETFSGVIDRKANLSRILKILEKGGVRFKLNGKKLTVIP